MLVSQLKRPADRVRRHSVDRRYFDTIGPCQAYWLGYLLADGSIGLRRRDGKVRQCVLQAASKDREHLDKLRAALKSTYPLYGPYEGCWQLAIADYDLCLAVERFGVVPSKSLTAAPPNLPDELYRHWARGVVDGDGSFNRYHRPSRAVKNNGRGRPPRHDRSVLMLWVVGSEAVTRWFKDRFGGYAGRKAGVWQWGLNDSRAAEVVDWLYADSDQSTRLDRKYELAVNLGIVKDDDHDRQSPAAQY